MKQLPMAAMGQKPVVMKIDRIDTGRFYGALAL